MTPRPHPARHALSACAALCLLTACGGGGGDSPAATPAPTPAPTPLTFKCWNDVVLSSTTAQPGKADCAPAPLPTFTIEGNTPKIVFDARLGVQSATVLLTTTPTTTVTGGTWNYVATNGALVPVGAATVTYSTGYTLMVSAVYTTAPNLTNYSVGIISGANPLIAQAQAKIVPQGVQRAVPATEVPTSATLSTHDGFLSCVVSGCALLADSGDKMVNHPNPAYRNLDLVYAIYRQNGNYYIKPLFKVTLKGATDDDRLAIGLTGGTFDRVQGAPNGLLVRNFNPSTGMYQCSVAFWDSSAIGFAGKPSTACSAGN